MTHTQHKPPSSQELASLEADEGEAEALLLSGVRHVANKAASRAFLSLLFWSLRS